MPIPPPPPIETSVSFSKVELEVNSPNSPSSPGTDLIGNFVKELANSSPPSLPSLPAATAKGTKAPKPVTTADSDANANTYNEELEPVHSYQYFVEMDELEYVPPEDNPSGPLEPVWVETAHWRNGLEEDVEYDDKGVEKFGVAHSSGATMHGLFALRTELKESVMLFDLDKSDLEGIASSVVGKMVETDILDDTASVEITRAILAHHHHAQSAERHLDLARRELRRKKEREKKFKALARRRSSWVQLESIKDLLKSIPQSASRGGSIAGSRANSQPGSKHPSTDNLQELDDTNTATTEAATEVEAEAEANAEDKTGTMELELVDTINKALRPSPSPSDVPNLFSEDKEGEFYGEDEAFDIMVGSCPFLDRKISAFVRLKTSTVVGELAEEGYRTRDLFLCLGPAEEGDDIWQIGRSFAVLMSQVEFAEQIDTAKTKKDIVKIVDNFIDSSVVVPKMNMNSVKETGDSGYNSDDSLESRGSASSHHSSQHSHSSERNGGMVKHDSDRRRSNCRMLDENSLKELQKKQKSDQKKVGWFGKICGRRLKNKLSNAAEFEVSEYMPMVSQNRTTHP